MWLDNHTNKHIKWEVICINKAENAELKPRRQGEVGNFVRNGLIKSTITAGLLAGGLYGLTTTFDKDNEYDAYNRMWENKCIAGQVEKNQTSESGVYAVKDLDIDCGTERKDSSWVDWAVGFCALSYATGLVRMVRSAGKWLDPGIYPRF